MEQENDQIKKLAEESMLESRKGEDKDKSPTGNQAAWDNFYHQVKRIIEGGN